MHRQLGSTVFTGLKVCVGQEFFHTQTHLVKGVPDIKRNYSVGRAGAGAIGQPGRLLGRDAHGDAAGTQRDDARFRSTWSEGRLSVADRGGSVDDLRGEIGYLEGYRAIGHTAIDVSKTDLPLHNRVSHPRFGRCLCHAAFHPESG